MEGVEEDKGGQEPKGKVLGKNRRDLSPSKKIMDGYIFSW
jgi:hypothetical protein